VEPPHQLWRRGHPDFALSILLQATVLLMPFFVQLTIDQAIGQNDANLLTVLLVGFAIIYALAAVTAALRSWVVLTVSESLSFQLAGNIVRPPHPPAGRLFRAPPRRRPAVAHRLHRTDQGIADPGRHQRRIDAVLALTTVIVMTLISPTLTMVVVGFTFVYFLVSMAMYPGLRRRTEEEIVARARQETHLMESMRAIRAIKLHTHEAARKAAGATIMPTSSPPATARACTISG
jgi:ATP-binding cassette subfamily B protein RaxB